VFYNEVIAWSELRDFPGYWVNTRGEIGKGRPEHGEWTPLPTRVHPDGHVIIDIRSDGKRKTHKLHILILEAFVGPRPKGFETCHDDDNPLNNNISNLRFASHSQNARDAYRNGKRTGKRILDAETVIAARVAHAAGEAVCSIARRLRVKRCTVRDAVKRRTWRHVA
jgi:hypothetical protein